MTGRKVNFVSLCGTLDLCGEISGGTHASGVLCTPEECVPPTVHHKGTEISLRLTKILLAITILFTLGFLPAVYAQVARPIEDPAIEARMKYLTKELRCLVCQNETLADSQAPLAEDLRREIREQIKAGKSDQEILAYATQRYGDFVLYNPPVKASTYLLWFGPFVLLVGGTAFLYRYVKRRRDLIEAKPLTSDERSRAEKLLKEM
ncbi:MAG: cytochrome c-type biogenesis protein [Pyrinomonadaceae bacterium]